MENWEKAERFWKEFFPTARGRGQPGSGNQPGAKGDTRYVERVQFTFDERVLLESKQTDKNSISIKLEWLDKIDLEAATLGRCPLVGLTINGRTWLMLPSWVIKTNSAGDS